MSLNESEVLNALRSFAALGESAKALHDEIKASREDGELSDAERKRLRKAFRKLAKEAGPVFLQLAIDSLD